jgi:ribonucleotide reductase alpha subunit
MNETTRTTFATRLQTAADAKKALLAKFKPKAAVADPLFETRDAVRAEELAQVRADRSEARAAARQAVADAAAAAQQVLDDEAASTLNAKRGATKERKALSAAEAKAKRDSRYAARKARS